MTYDNWKTTEPEYEDGEPRGYCDCCNKYRPLTRCWASGIETFACDECRGIETDEADDSDHAQGLDRDEWPVS